MSSDSSVRETKHPTNQPPGFSAECPVQCEGKPHFFCKPPEQDGWHLIMDPNHQVQIGLRDGLDEPSWKVRGMGAIFSEWYLIGQGWQFGPRITLPPPVPAQSGWVEYDIARTFPDGTLVVVRRDAGPIKFTMLTWYLNDWDSESSAGRQFLRLDTIGSGAVGGGEALKAEVKAAQDSEEAMSEKLRSLLAGGHTETCGCSYDRKDDICMHHSPRLSSVTADRDRLRNLLGRISKWDQLPNTGDGPYWIQEITAALGGAERD